MTRLVCSRPSLSHEMSHLLTTSLPIKLVMYFMDCKLESLLYHNLSDRMTLDKARQKMLSPH